jgi:AcrR family transcriptional regulator
MEYDDMTLRQRQSDLTRQAILQAAADLFLEEEGDISMQNVADRAGVSHRTLYRYFPSRKDLFNEVGPEIDAALVAAVPADYRVESFDEWVAKVGTGLRFGEAQSIFIRKALAASIRDADWRTDRDERYWTMFRERFADLDEAEARGDFAILRHLAGSSSYVLIVERFDLEMDQAESALERAVAALMADIDRRNRAARKNREGNK